MDVMRDKWDIIAMVTAIALVAAGGYFRSQEINQRIDRFESRMFEAEWQLGPDLIIRPIAKE